MSEGYPPDYTPSVPETSGKAIASLVLGILGPFTCAILGIIAIPLGHAALSDIRARPGVLVGDGLAKAGIILGWINVALLVLAVIWVVFIVILGVAMA